MTISLAKLKFESSLTPTEWKILIPNS
jgi:hypothetical protein